MTLTAYLRLLRDRGPQPVGKAPEAVIRDAQDKGFVRYVKPHCRAITHAGVKFLDAVEALG